MQTAPSNLFEVRPKLNLKLHN